jgi:hypothetical protein
LDELNAGDSLVKVLDRENVELKGEIAALRERIRLGSGPRDAGSREEEKARAEQRRLEREAEHEKALAKADRKRRALEDEVAALKEKLIDVQGRRASDRDEIEALKADFLQLVGVVTRPHREMASWSDEADGSGAPPVPPGVSWSSSLARGMHLGDLVAALRAFARFNARKDAEQLARERSLAEKLGKGVVAAAESAAEREASRARAMDQLNGALSSENVDTRERLRRSEEARRQAAEDHARQLAEERRSLEEQRRITEDTKAECRRLTMLANDLQVNLRAAQELYEEALRLPDRKDTTRTVKLDKPRWH